MPRILTGNRMKKTQVKDSLRNIKKQIVSYLSILVISMLAVLTYLGINYSAEAIRNNSSAFYDSTNFRDAEILSTYMITPDDLEALRALEGISDVEGVYRINGNIYGDGVVTGVMVVSLTERINQPLLISGRMPQAPNECVIEPEVRLDAGLKIGDTISILDSHHVRPQYLERCDYIITGIVRHPDHSCIRNVSPGPRYVMVLPEEFDSEALEGCYMSAEVTIEGADQYRITDDDYLEYVSGVISQINDLADERALIRYDEVRERYQSRIEEGQAQLDDAEGLLDDARNELDQHWQEYYDGVARLNDAEQELSQAESQLSDARSQLASGQSQLDEAAAQLADARTRLDNARTELDSGWAQLEEGRIQLEQYAIQIEQGQARLSLAESQLEAAQIRLQAAEAQLEEGRWQLQSSYTQIEDAKTDIRDRLRQAIIAVLGEQIADRIDWSDSTYTIDLDDPTTTATLLHISEGVTIDLNRSLGDNIFTLLSSLGIPEDELRSAYETATGAALVIIDGRPVLELIADAVVETYGAADNAYNEYAGLAVTWDNYHNEYINGLNLYNQGVAAYSAGMEQFVSGQDALDAGIEQYNTGLQQYNDGLAQYEAAHAQYLEGEAQYAEGLAEYNARLAEYNQAQAQYEEGLEQYEEGVAQYEQGQDELAEGLESLEEGEAEYEEGVDRYSDGQERLQEAIDNMEMLDDCHWSVLTPEGNAGYFQIRNDARNVSDMGGTIAFVFILVGALVIYATVGRIIDEQRRLVGTSKALGMYNKEIFMKYLSFGVTSTFAGEVGGIILGYFFIQKIYLMLYGRNYLFDMTHRSIVWWITFVVFAAGIAIASLTVWFACSNLMRSTAITLMQDSVPNIKRKSKKGRSKRSRGSLYRSMIFLNMLSDKKRVIVTIVSIAGSCTLLVTGMAMNFNIKNTIKAQFGEVEVYDLKLTYDSQMSDKAESQIQRVLDEYDVSYMPVRSAFTTYDFGGKLSAFELIVADFNKLDEFYQRRDVDTNEICTGGGSGIWIFQRLAESLDIGPGSWITVYDSAMNPHRVNVEGVFTDYIGQQVIMSPQLYASVFDEDPQYNSIYVNLNGTDAEVITDRLSTLIGYTGFKDAQERYNSAMSFASVLDYISLIFVLAAGLMSYFILLNLVNMYVHQKKLELTIMRINGFTVREVIYYVSLELIVCTVLGIILGLGLGSFLSYRVIRLLESLFLHIIRAVSFKSWIIATLITIVFTTIVSSWALRKVKNLNLTDINN